MCALPPEPLAHPPDAVARVTAQTNPRTLSHLVGEPARFNMSISRISVCFYPKDPIILSRPGPIITSSTAGKMNSTAGSSIFTAAAWAVSSAC